jgi:RNA polymerase sigma-70 factor (ECF subfamily)
VASKNTLSNLGITRTSEILLRSASQFDKLRHNRTQSLRDAMAARSSKSVTRLLKAWSQGDEGVLEELMPRVYSELRRLARRYMMRERPDHTLQVTALVNEAYLRLIDAQRVQWQDRAHFFAISAQMMRRILVDWARSREYLKRGGGLLSVSLEECPEIVARKGQDLVAIDDALRSLAAFDSRKSQIVELRFFGGLSVEEISQVLSVSPRTVLREWGLAKAWLYNAVTGSK